MYLVLTGSCTYTLVPFSPVQPYHVRYMPNSCQRQIRLPVGGGEHQDISGDNESTKEMIKATKRIEQTSTKRHNEEGDKAFDLPAALQPLVKGYGSRML